MTPFPGAPRPAQIRRLGRVLYPAGLRMQQAMAEHVRNPEADRPDQILVLEHNPVFTLGRNASRQDIHVSDPFLIEHGVEVHETDRGGQVTYHGPGQIVVYPVCNLKGGREDVGRLVRGLEQAMIDTAADFGVAAQRLAGFPGVWAPWGCTCTGGSPPTASPSTWPPTWTPSAGSPPAASPTRACAP